MDEVNRVETCDRTDRDKRLPYLMVGAAPNNMLKLTAVRYEDGDTVPSFSTATY